MIDDQRRASWCRLRGTLYGHSWGVTIVHLCLTADSLHCRLELEIGPHVLLKAVVHALPLFPRLPVSVSRVRLTLFWLLDACFYLRRGGEEHLPYCLHATTVMTFPSMLSSSSRLGALSCQRFDTFHEKRQAERSQAWKAIDARLNRRYKKKSFQHHFISSHCQS